MAAMLFIEQTDQFKKFSKMLAQKYKFKKSDLNKKSDFLFL